VSQRKVAVIGGGWAGLAAAIEATRQGDAVTLIEMAPQLGGRARRVDAGELVLDNGQHILIGAYTETLRLIRLVGVDPAQAFVRTPLRLHDPSGHGLSLPSGPPMLAFLRGVVNQQGWTWHERLRLLMAAAGWRWRRFECDAALSVAELTATLPAALRRDLVDPLCVAALNTPAQLASASVFLRVIHDALFAGPGSADLLLPRQRLSDLLPTPAAAWLQRSGAAIRLGRRVERLAQQGTQWAVDGQPFDQVVLAATATEAARLAQPVAPEWAAMAAALRYEPIVTVYAQSDGTRLPQPMLALRSDDAQLPAQFVFDHGQLGGRPGLLAFVISGAQGWLDRGPQATRQATLAQGQAQLGAHLKEPLRHLRDLTEKRATFRCVPALVRPPMQILPGLHAAGDYVAGPYPATLEGAVRSGVAAVSQHAVTFFAMQNYSNLSQNRGS
jgi:squalene-associated FAD-dependent desaturase